MTELLRRRLSAGMTQTELALRAGVSRNTIGPLERGEISDPQAPTLKKLADALGCEPTDLLSPGPEPTVPEAA